MIHGGRPEKTVYTGRALGNVGSQGRPPEWELLDPMHFMGYDVQVPALLPITMPAKEEAQRLVLNAGAVNWEASGWRVLGEDEAGWR